MRTTLALCLLLTACAADGSDSPDGGAAPDDTTAGPGVLMCAALGYNYPEHGVANGPGEPTRIIQAWECIGTPEQVQRDFGKAWHDWCLPLIDCSLEREAEGWCRCEPECVRVPAKQLVGYMGSLPDGGFPECDLDVLLDPTGG